MNDHDIAVPSAWVTRWGSLITHGEVLDVACGSGRHARWFAGRGISVVAVDRVMRSIRGVRFVQADLETGHGWPFPAGRFAGVVVANYLHRPLFADLRASLAPDGLLIYETFMSGNERHGRPSNPAFLLQPGELLSVFSDLRILAFEQGTVKAPKTAVIQRLCAIAKQKV